MPSSISAARAGLWSLLGASAALAGVQLSFGLPPDVASERQEVVLLLGLSAPSEDAAALGNKRREEVYEIVVGLKVYDPAGTAQSVDVRAWQLADAVRDAVIASTTLGGASGVLWAHPVATRSEGVLPAQGGGYVIFATVNVRVVARL